MAVITVNGEFGTESEQLVAELARQMKYDHIGAELLKQIAEQLHLIEQQDHAESLPRGLISTVMPETTALPWLARPAPGPDPGVASASSSTRRCDVAVVAS